MLRNTPKVLSLFSGAGGMDVGLERAGFDTVASFDFEPIAQETLRLNRPQWLQPLDGDVIRASREFHPADLGMQAGELDLLAGGPPCQPFSSAAQWSGTGRLGMKDDRALTVHALLDMIETWLPKAVLIENVKGFMVGRNAAFPEIDRRLAKIRNESGVDYSLEWRSVNAANYGVPQNRVRAIVVLTRDSQKFRWPAEEFSGQPVSAGRALASVPHEAPVAMRGKWADLLPSIPPGENYLWLTARGGGQELFGYRTRYWNFLLKLDPTAPSWTLAASPGPSTGPFHWENRPLTSAEAMRLQSFPDGWKLAGSYRQRMKQIGNATPPRLAWAFGTAILKALGHVPVTGGFLDWPNGDVSRSTSVAKVPDKYLGLVGEKSAHPGHGKGPGVLRPLQG